MFVQALKEVYEEFYPDSNLQLQDDVYSRLVSSQAYGRIASLLENTKGCRLVFGGQVDKDTKYISPTVVKDVGPDD